ncbi:hypothetical protein F1737_08970 [Methanoplanus sp. FWC-SCC4]|uniref:Uncharacterized protein n=1 Tax=Methanochimaera problematica TaxID=2609417 RepID=A0AA97I4D0_9EURY|nr:hypothetical protein [Methanoplanus sp. FWC-SCC4]WOF16811.1 hypothetical protein F1737_08970 [Methanoplanus sp. FWC-SCC4]
MKEFTKDENEIIWNLVGDEIKRISDNFYKIEKFEEIKEKLSQLKDIESKAGSNMQHHSIISQEEKR